jgi:DNA-binding XRE family transcriptional regulator
MKQSELARSAGSPLATLVRDARLPAPAERKRIREAAGVSLRQMAAELGVSPMSTSAWERGEVEPRLDHAAAYGRLLAELESAVAP